MRYYNLIIILMIPISTFSQISLYTISGKVLDEKNNTLPFANVAVYNSDKSLQNGVITLDDGSFTIENLTAGTYTLSISFVGYTTHNETIELQQSRELLEIKLKEDALSLQTVQVMGYRKLIKSDNGKTTLNVEGSMLGSMPSATMIMSFVPGVALQGEKVEVIGKGTPIIFIDGREVKNQSQISTLQPERIKSITVDRNPSAKYDARYASVILIETIPTKKQEFSAQLVHGSAMGNRYSHTERININHSTGKWTNYLSYRYKNEQGKEGVEVFQNVWQNNISQKNSYDANLIQKQHLNRITFGSNLKINEKHSVDLQYLLNKDKGNFEVQGTESLSGLINSHYSVKRKGNDYSLKHNVNFNYRWQIDSLSTFNFFTDYAHIGNKDVEFVKNIVQNTNVTERYVLNNHSAFNTYALRAEYGTKLFGSFDFNGGVSFSEIQSNTHSIIDNLQQENTDNHSQLTEYTISAYSTLGKQMNRLSAEIGLRGEQNRSDYLKNGQSVFGETRVLTNFFPSLAVSYRASDNARLSFNYASKISRPRFSDLDPSVNYLSSVLYEQGNPELLPEIRHSVSLGVFWGRNLNLSVGYSHNQNAIAYIIERDKSNPNILINRSVNIKKSSLIDLNAFYSISKGKWQSNLIGNISIPFLEYPYQGEVKTNNIPRFQFVTTNMYMVLPNVFLMGNFMVQSRYSHLNNQMSPTYNLVLVANFVMFNGKMTLTIFGNDLLKKSQSNTYSEWGNISTGQNLRPNSREIGLSLKFNLNKFKSIFKQSESNSDILKRIEKE